MMNRLRADYLFHFAVVIVAMSVAGAALAAAPGLISAMSGDGALTAPTDTTGACSDTGCNASKGDCECLAYTGVFTIAPFGKANFSFNQTLNDDDTVNTGGGTGICFPFSGIGTITGPGEKPASVTFNLTGTTCNNFDLTPSAILETNGAYYIVPGKGAGKYANVGGAGSMALGMDLDANIAIVHIGGNIVANIPIFHVGGIQPNQ